MAAERIISKEGWKNRAEQLAAAIEEIVKAWEGGNLASAVNKARMLVEEYELDSATEEPKDTQAKKRSRPQKKS